jgi:hypothetical protein
MKKLKDRVFLHSVECESLSSLSRGTKKSATKLFLTTKKHDWKMIEKARYDPAVNIAPWRRRPNAHAIKIWRGYTNDVALLNVI